MRRRGRLRAHTANADETPVRMREAGWSKTIGIASLPSREPSRPLTKRASPEGNQRVLLPNCAQPRPESLFGRPRIALFEAHGPETLEIVDAEAFTSCGDTKNAASQGSRRRALTQRLPTLEVRKGSPTRTRTLDLAVNSRSLYQLSYRGITPLYANCRRPNWQGGRPPEKSAGCGPPRRNRDAPTTTGD